jgi:uncharacterized repeat protein (TIGR03803 family)
MREEAQTFVIQPVGLLKHKKRVRPTFGPLVNATNFDGANPPDQLVLSEDVLYGTATAGGAKGGGTVFSLTLPAAQSPPLLSAVSPVTGSSTLTIS